MNIARSKAVSPANLLEAGRPLTIAHVVDGAEGMVLADLARTLDAKMPADMPGQVQSWLAERGAVRTATPPASTMKGRAGFFVTVKCASPRTRRTTVRVRQLPNIVIHCSGDVRRNT